MRLGQVYYVPEPPHLSGGSPRAPGAVAASLSEKLDIDWC